VNTTKPAGTAATRKPAPTIAEMPELAAEWDTARNGDLTPSDVRRYSPVKIAWICPRGHQYEATAKNRSYGGTGCPTCYNEARRNPKTPRPGRSVAEAFPAIAAEWDHQANHPLTPSDVSVGSGRQVSWVCPNGHAPYRQRVEMRTARKMGCPECGKEKTSAAGPKPGRSLAEAFPEVAAEWDYEANHPLTPEGVGGRSNKKAFFICPRGHGSHEAYISNRTAGNKCPKCAAEDKGPNIRRKNLALKALPLSSPELTAEWNTERNELTPSDVTCGSLARVWWNCPKGHDPYLAAITHRFHGGTGCPVCGVATSIAALARFRYTGPAAGASLGDARPEFIASWDVEKNGSLTAFEVAPTSHRKVHWLCPEGHSFQRAVRERILLKSCPVCRAGQRASAA
jgi:Zn ribbon nucleic-acid-binding protein